MITYKKEFSELTTKEFYEIAKLRVSVFVVEQNCPYQEIDEEDETALHLWLEEENEIVGYARIMDNKETASFGRVLVNPKYRGQGLGRTLVDEVLSEIAQRYPNKTILIGGQAYLKEFYESFGFQTISDIYLEDDIPHYQMERLPD
ncbi:MAG: GNAT family N-acetyltransferase [Lactobacillales bacterium]|jgi:ElaA protein|nr:GNAT family N-acetyltransferase [Lactobacillales bacterium]